MVPIWGLFCVSHIQTVCITGNAVLLLVHRQRTEAKIMEVTQTQDEGYTVYIFTANFTRYEVLTNNGETFIVYSARKSLSNRRPKPQYYDSLQDLAKRSKALRNLAALIAA